MEFIKRKFETRAFLPWLAAGVAAFFLTVIELVHPLFFLQDDNLGHYLPAAAHNLRALGEGGLALFNFHQFCGIPALSSGLDAVLYPPLYICAAISWVFSGGIYWTIDLLVILHLCFAAAGTVLFLKELGAEDAGAFFGGVTWPLCGFAAGLSAVWWFTAAAAAFLPWLMYLSLKLAAAPERKLFWAATLLRTMFCLCGQFQYFVYVCIIELAVVCGLGFLRGKLSGLRFYFASVALTALFAMPLILPVWHQSLLSDTRHGRISYHAFTAAGNRIVPWLIGLFAPLADISRMRVTVVSTWVDDCLPYLAHAGYLVPLLAGAAVLRLRKSSLEERFAVLCLAVCAVWGFGFLDFALYNVPVLNKFRYPLRTSVGLNFFFIASAALAVSWLARRFGARLARAVVVLNLLGLLAFHMAAGSRSFFMFDGRVLPPAEPRGAFTDGRILSLGDFPSHGRAALMHMAGYNFATLTGRYHLAGENPMTPQANSDVAGGLNWSSIIHPSPAQLAGVLPHFRDWSVRYYVADAKVRGDYAALFAKENIVPVEETARYTVYRDSAALPFAYVDGGGENAVTTVFRVNSARLDAVVPAPSEAVLNCVYSPFFSATDNGVRTGVYKTSEHKTAVRLSAGRHVVVIRYFDPWFAAGLAAALIALLAAWPLLRWLSI